ncbi:MAG: hypothetical protein M3291_12070 [Actinomycetota bacterium]|nr:hypothetical protein [Actinomycetota bacterium]
MLPGFEGHEVCRTLRRPVGDRHLAVASEHVAGFRKAPRTLSYALAPTAAR